MGGCEFFNFFPTYIEIIICFSFIFFSLFKMISSLREIWKHPYWIITTLKLHVRRYTLFPGVYTLHIMRRNQTSKCPVPLHSYIYTEQTDTKKLFVSINPKEIIKILFLIIYFYSFRLKI